MCCVPVPEPEHVNWHVIIFVAMNVEWFFYSMSIRIGRMNLKQMNKKKTDTEQILIDRGKEKRLTNVFDIYVLGIQWRKRSPSRLLFL